MVAPIGDVKQRVGSHAKDTQGRGYDGYHDRGQIPHSKKKTRRKYRVSVDGGDRSVGMASAASTRRRTVVGRESLLLADIRAFDKWNMLRETETVIKTFDGYGIRKEVVHLRQMYMACPKSREEIEDEETRLKIHAEQKAALLHRLSGKDAIPSDYVMDDVPVRIGSSTAARNGKALGRCGVTHVLNVSAIVPSYFRDDGIEYLKIPIFDDENVDIRRYFDQAFAFMDQGCQHGCVLVHCCAGQSRSVAFVIGYLMSRKGMRFEEALGHVKRVRTCAAPNVGFVKQLKEV